MKKNAPERIFLSPAPKGWLVQPAEKPAQFAGTLAAAAALIPAGSAVHLALPVRSLIIERLVLPATQREELAGMVRLQSEKTLFFPMEEVTNDFVTVATMDQESAVLSVTAPHAALEVLCAPLRERKLVPERVTPYVFHVAAACPPGECVLAIYQEEEQCVVAIVESGNPSWVHVLPEMEPERLTDELPQLLLSAMMEGVPTTFARVLLAEPCKTIEPALRDYFDFAPESLPPPKLPLEFPIDLAPASWQELKDHLLQTQKLQQRLLIGAAAYLAIGVGALLYLAVLRHGAGNLDQQFAKLRPQLELIQRRQARANALAPTIDPHRYNIELLYLLLRNLPSDEVRITEFDQNPSQWRIVGEAPSAALAIDFVTRLKAEQDLSAYTIEAGPPRLLPNEHAQFSIFGKR